MRRRDAHEECRNQRRCRRAAGFIRHAVDKDGGDWSEPSWHEDADIIERHGHAERFQGVENESRGELKSGIDGGANRAAEWVP